MPVVLEELGQAVLQHAGQRAGAVFLRQLARRACRARAERRPVRRGPARLAPKGPGPSPSSGCAAGRAARPAVRRRWRGRPRACPPRRWPRGRRRRWGERRAACAADRRAGGVRPPQSRSAAPASGGRSPARATPPRSGRPAPRATFGRSKAATARCGTRARTSGGRTARTTGHRPRSSATRRGSILGEPLEYRDGARLHVAQRQVQEPAAEGAAQRRRDVHEEAAGRLR